MIKEVREFCAMKVISVSGEGYCMFCSRLEFDVWGFGKGISWLVQLRRLWSFEFLHHLKNCMKVESIRMA